MTASEGSREVCSFPPLPSGVHMPNAVLALGDGTIFEGEVFGSSRPVCGEVVFNTGMTGYVETSDRPLLRGSDPGPHVSADRELWRARNHAREGYSRRPYESDRIQVQGLSFSTTSTITVITRRSGSLRQWLLDEDVPAVTGVDTRTLTRRLREHGTMQGWMFPADDDAR